MKSGSHLFICTVSSNPRLPIGPEMVFSPKALCQAFDFLVRRQPEAGGLLFGPFNQAGIDTFIADISGSERASRSVYSPDHVVLDQVAKEQASQGREIKGVVHTHPQAGGATFPSREVSYGRGDRGYARKFFDYNEAAQHLLFPILTYNETEITISPYVFKRGEPGHAPELQWAPFSLKEAKAFGAWEYNPRWLATVSETHTNTQIG